MALREEKVIVIDLGAQYAQLIARRVRQCHVYCEILPHDTPAEKIKKHNPRGVILSGGPMSIHDPEAVKPDLKIFDLGIPVLGICYGHQLISQHFGGEVKPAEKREYGRTELYVLDDSDLFKGLNPRLICWTSHSEVVTKPPQDFKVTAKTLNTPVAAISDPKKRLFGVQFHPEVTHTPWGIDIIRNFLYDWCGCKGLWRTESFVEETIHSIKGQVGEGKVICALSGGVDSSTTAALVHKAVGEQLTCVFVNHGLLRKGEPESVCNFFKENMKVNLVAVDASERFLKRLQGVTDPEEKRKIIGEEFIKVFEEVAGRLGRVEFLAQGTLYPDVIESGTRAAARIKTHHNVGGLPERMQLKLVEPLRHLFKDEVREIAQQLGLPSEIVWRQPFPGPGLAIRTLGEVTREKLEILREADAIVEEEMKRAGLYRPLWQAFVVLLPLKTVGVMGDQRTYAYVVALRAVQSEDGMTADWARLPHEVLERISSRIVSEVEGVNRVVYDVTSKPPATIEWE